MDRSGIVSPDEVLNSLNWRFPFERFDSYFTIVYLLLDLSNGALTYASAGHPPPLVLRRDGTIETLELRGPIIGLSDETRYRQDKLQLSAGDSLLLYTDGVLDIRDPHGEFFGRRRLIEIVRDYRGESIQRIVAGVSERLGHFGRSRAPEDDISLLGVQYTG